MPPQVAVDPGGGGGVHEATEPGIHRQVLRHEFLVPAQLMFLVVVLRQIEAAGLRHQSVDLGPARLGDPPHGRLGQPLLPFIVVEDRRHVLPTPRPGARVVAAAEHLEQLRVGDPARIEIDLDGLGMVSEAAVGGVLAGATAVADPCADDARQTPEPGVRTPESTQGEGGGLDHRRCVDIHGWNATARAGIPDLAGQRNQGGSGHQPSQGSGLSRSHHQQPLIRSSGSGHKRIGQPPPAAGCVMPRTPQGRSHGGQERSEMPHLGGILVVVSGLTPR